RDRQTGLPFEIDRHLARIAAVAAIAGIVGGSGRIVRSARPACARLQEVLDARGACSRRRYGDRLRRCGNRDGTVAGEAAGSSVVIEGGVALAGEETISAGAALGADDEAGKHVTRGLDAGVGIRDLGRDHARLPGPSAGTSGFIALEADGASVT